MKNIPSSEGETPLVRTDFSDQGAWEALVTAVTTPNEDEFLANLHIVDDPAYRDLTSEQVVALAPGELLVVVADSVAVASAEWSVLVLHRTERGHDELRVAAESLWAVENNISIANMDWREFAEAVDDDGVLRGY